MRNIALVLKYRGTNYHGWQSQENALSVQDVLSRAIERLTGELPLPYLAGCGRTDAGVHAARYVASFKTASKISAERFAPALNALLPEDIAVGSAHDVAEDFNARFGCKKKEYIYRIYDGRHRDPFHAGLALHYPRRLDEGLMARAAEACLGEQDFSSFRAAGSGVKTSVRTIFSAGVKREGELVSISLCANGFLYNMVRIIAGTLVYISEGKIPSDGMAAIIQKKDRQAAGITLPPCGLYLNRLWYDEAAISD